jgi:hypothetical protein
MRNVTEKAQSVSNSFPKKANLLKHEKMRFLLSCYFSAPIQRAPTRAPNTPAIKNSCQLPPKNKGEIQALETPKVAICK